MEKELLLNNYPTKFINEQIKNYSNRQKYPKQENKEFDCRKNFVMPYVWKITEKFKYTSENKFQINTIYRFPSKLNSIIKLQKDKLKK